jgi:hypothetical protein
LTNGQRNITGKFASDRDICSPEEKKAIDDAVIGCICEDSRPFNDFTKPGMRKVFKLLKPGYKPMARNTINKRIKIKSCGNVFIFFNKNLFPCY